MGHLPDDAPEAGKGYGTPAEKEGGGSSLMLKQVDIYITHTIRGYVADNAQYAYALIYNGVPRYGYGEIDRRITQNRIVLLSMKEALARMLCPCEITLYMNSQYIASAFHNGNAKTWKQNGYEKAAICTPLS